MYKYSPTTQGFYLDSVHSDIPADAVALTTAEYAVALEAKNNGGQAEALNGKLVFKPRAVSADELLDRIDTAADAARRAVAGDPLRAVEYDRARLAAEQFAAADYQGEAPAMVAAWAINGRTPQQAADSILAEAAAYTNALELLRATRLAAKEQVRALMAANQVAQAQQLTDQTIASIDAAVAGIGNNA